MSQDPYDQSQERSHRRQEPRSFPAFGGEIAGGHRTPTDQASRESGQGSAWNREPDETGRGQSQSDQAGGLHRGALGSERGTGSQDRDRSRNDDRQRRRSSAEGGGGHRTTDHRSQEQLQGPPSARREGRPGESQREEHAPGRGVGDAGDRPPGHERGRFQEGRGGMASNPPRSPEQRRDRDVHGQGRVQQDQTRTAGRSEREQQSHGGPRSHGQRQGQPHGGDQSSWQPWKQRSEPPEGSQFSSQGGTRSGSEGIGRGRSERGSQRQGQHGQHGQQGARGGGQQRNRGGGQQRSQHTGQQRSQGRGQQQNQGAGQQQGRGGGRQQGQQGGQSVNAGSNQRGSQQQYGGQQGGQPDEGLLYGGQAQHGHEPSHVGAEQTFGEPMEQSQQGRRESNLPHQWQEQRQTYPDSYRGGEAYDYQHRHGDDQADWPLGAPPEEGRR